MRAINSPVDRGTRRLDALGPTGADFGLRRAHIRYTRSGRALSEDYGTVPVSVTRGVYKSLKTR
jgi:hypothetical protein